MKIDILRRIKNATSATFNYLRWSWRFGAFPFRCRLGSPDNIKNARAIFFGRKVQIYKGSRLEAIGKWDGKTPKISIGNNTKIMYYFHCGAAVSVKIGSNVLIGSRVYITDHDHVFGDSLLSANENKELIYDPVILEDGCYIGEGAVILKGVRIGRRAVIGANSLVTEDISPWTVVGGVPAKVLKAIKPKA